MYILPCPLWCVIYRREPSIAEPSASERFDMVPDRVAASHRVGKQEAKKGMELDSLKQQLAIFQCITGITV